MKEIIPRNSIIETFEHEGIEYVAIGLKSEDRIVAVSVSSTNPNLPILML